MVETVAVAAADARLSSWHGGLQVQLTCAEQAASLLSLREDTGCKAGHDCEDEKAQSPEPFDWVQPTEHLQFKASS